METYPLMFERAYNQQGLVVDMGSMLVGTGICRLGSRKNSTVGGS